MRTIYEAESIIDAMLVKHALEHVGIPSFVTGAHLAGAIGELPMQGLIRVQVPDSAEEEASRIVAELDLGREALGDAQAWDPHATPSGTLLV